MARSPFDGGYPMIGLLSSFNALALTTDSSDQVSVHAQSLFIFFSSLAGGD